MFAWLASTVSISPIPQPTRDSHGRRNCWLTSSRRSASEFELLEAKTAEYQKWLARRDEFSKRAQETVVTIYARMKPEAAAAQLVAMDEETAAAVLTKLDPRNASAILSEMEATQAARLAATIAGAANVNLPGRAVKSQTGDKRS